MMARIESIQCGLKVKGIGKPDSSGEPELLLNHSFAGFLPVKFIYRQLILPYSDDH